MYQQTGATEINQAMMSLGNNGHRFVSVAGERQQKQSSKNKRLSEVRQQNFSDSGAVGRH